MATRDLTAGIPSSINAGDILNCPYSGNVISLTLPIGKYKLECWGAQGGGIQNNSSLDSKDGGKGGYSYGILTLSSSAIVYLYTGGMGSSIGSGLAAGGFNGGGTAYGTSTSEPANGGGGASDIRIGQDSLYSRVIVAGGGGGAGEDKGDTPGYGGGSTAGAGGGSGTAGTQTSAGTPGGAFGYGANTPNDGGGGGGGWYGGGTTNGSQNIPSANSTSDTSGGGGGSGYVYTSSTASNYPSGCLLNSSYYLTTAATVAGNSSFIDPGGSTVTGHEGNGYIRISVGGQINKPTGGSRTYTGSSQSYSLSGYNSTIMTISGTTSGTEIGSYTVTVSLKDTTLYSWSDGTTAAITVTWSIVAITPFMTKLSTQNKILMGSPVNLYVGLQGPGTFSASSSNTSIYTVSATSSGSGASRYGTITITPVAAGTATLTLSLAESSPYYAAASQTVSLTVVANTNKSLSSMAIGESNLYYYTGQQQSITIPAYYTVQIECWGAGGNYNTVATAGNIGNGGGGGYSKGILGYSTSNRTLYMHIGGMGSSVVGGWNGGGGQIFINPDNEYQISSTRNSGAGGGATDVSISSTSFSFNNQRFLQTTAGYKARIIVAGGGGATRTSSPASQTTEVGGYAPSTITTTVNESAGCMTAVGSTAGTQAAAPGFGYGGTAGYYSNDRAGAGGGWYGGSNHTDARAGGGSSFVWSDDHASYVPSGYTPGTAYKMTNIECIQGNATQPSPLNPSSTQTGNHYNGYIRITVINIITLVPMPTEGSVQYTGSSQQAANVLSGFNSTLMNISGDTSGTNVGEYLVEITLKNPTSYHWSNDTTNAVVCPWYITKKSVAKPTGGSTQWNNSSQSYVLNGFNSTYMTVSGTTSASAVGNYNITVSLSSTQNYQWDDGTTSSISLVWSIIKRTFIKPTGGERLWTGSSQSYAINNFDSTYMNITGTTSATNINSYNVTVSLKDTANSSWYDNTTTSLSLIWKIVGKGIFVKINNTTWKQVPKILIKTNSSTWNNNIATAYIKTVNGWKEISNM